MESTNGKLPELKGLRREDLIQHIAGLIADMGEPPVYESQPSIGIGITTHNREAQFKKTYEEIIRLAPSGAKIVVVDDASTKPIDIFATIIPDNVRGYRFDTNVGIARAKNKCLELLDDCDHIFLFDDDTFPMVENWYEPYINSGEAHLMYIFPDFRGGQGRLNDTTLVYKNDKIVAYSHARGCMLYLTKAALQAVGGMRPVFGKWGYEHPDLSNRIFNKGLTLFRYMDVVGSDKLFYAGDEHRTVQSSVSDHLRSQAVQRNKPLYDQYFDATDYIPYKDKRNVVLTCLFTNVVDPQRGQKWGPSCIDQVKPLIESLINRPYDLVILTDIPEAEFSCPMAQIIRVKTSINPYFQRWVSYYEYLRQHKDEYNDVFCVDATDVEMINTPPPLSPSELFTGYEPDVLDNDWMRNHHKSPEVVNHMLTHKNSMLLNAGVVGGHVDMLLKFLHKMVDNYSRAVTAAHEKNVPGPGDTDMGLFNYTCSSFNTVSNGNVTTVFKANEYNNYSWFKHK